MIDQATDTATVARAFLFDCFLERAERCCSPLLIVGGES